MFDYLRILMGCIQQTPYFNQFDRVCVEIGRYVNNEGVCDVSINLKDGDLRDVNGYPINPSSLITLKDLRDLYGLLIIGFKIVNFNEFLSHEDKYGVCFNNLRRI